MTVGGQITPPAPASRCPARRGLSVLDSGGYGWDGGLGTSGLVDPDDDLAAIVLTRRMFNGAVSAARPTPRGRAGRGAVRIWFSWISLLCRSRLAPRWYR